MKVVKAVCCFVQGDSCGGGEIKIGGRSKHGRTLHLPKANLTHFHFSHPGTTNSDPSPLPQRSNPRKTSLVDNAKWPDQCPWPAHKHYLHTLPPLLALSGTPLPSYSLQTFDCWTLTCFQIGPASLRVPSPPKTRSRTRNTVYDAQNGRCIASLRSGMWRRHET